MENRYKLTDEVRNKFKPIIQSYLDKMESLTCDEMENMEDSEMKLYLADKGINPYQLSLIIEEFGYEEVKLDENGWEMDFWWTFKRSDKKEFPSGIEKLCIAGCGITFDLVLEPN